MLLQGARELVRKNGSCTQVDTLKEGTVKKSRAVQCDQRYSKSKAAITIRQPLQGGFDKVTASSERISGRISEDLGSDYERSKKQTREALLPY